MASIGRDTTITWLGHGTFHIRTPGGKKLLIDAWVDTNPACPDEWKSRVKHEGLDAILVTHGHFDHINDLLSLATLTNAKIVCMFDLVSWLTAQGVEEERLVGFNKGGTVDLGGGERDQGGGRVDQIAALGARVAGAATGHHQGGAGRDAGQSKQGHGMPFLQEDERDEAPHRRRCGARQP